MCAEKKEGLKGSVALRRKSKNQLNTAYAKF